LIVVLGLLGHEKARPDIREEDAEQHTWCQRGDRLAHEVGPEAKAVLKATFLGCANWPGVDAAMSAPTASLPYLPR
jgi:hypothetical protein